MKKTLVNILLIVVSFVLILIMGQYQTAAIAAGVPEVDVKMASVLSMAYGAMAYILITRTILNKP